jgi:hypothetical protein
MRSRISLSNSIFVCLGDLPRIDKVAGHRVSDDY